MEVQKERSQGLDVGKALPKTGGQGGQKEIEQKFEKKRDHVDSGRSGEEIPEVERTSDGTIEDSSEEAAP